MATARSKALGSSNPKNVWGNYFRSRGSRWTQAEESSLGKKYVAVHKHPTRSGKRKGSEVTGIDVARHEVPKHIKVHPRGSWEKQSE